jgi:hypothetical protein
MIDYAKILSTNYVGKKWVLNGDFYEGLEWHDSSPKPTQAELDSQWIVIQADISANEYQTKRAAEYPSIAEQLDTLYHGGLTEWKATIKAVKDKYPKE